MEERLHHPTSISQTKVHKKKTTSIIKKNFHKQKNTSKRKKINKQKKFHKQTNFHKQKNFQGGGEISVKVIHQWIPLKYTCIPLFLYRRNDFFLWEGLVSKNVNTSYIQTINGICGFCLCEEIVCAPLLYCRPSSLVQSIPDVHTGHNTSRW